MGSSLISTADIENVVQSGLPDRSLEIFIDAADARIIDQWGPHSGERVYEEHLQPYMQQTYLYFPVPAVSVSEVKVWYYYQTEVDGIVLTHDTEYRLDNGGRRIYRQDQFWEHHVKITYTPQSTSARRSQALVELVKLALAFDGHQQSRTGMDGQTMINRGKEERRILEGIQNTYGGGGLFR